MPTGHGVSSLVEVLLLLSDSLRVRFPRRAFILTRGSWAGGWAGLAERPAQNSLVPSSPRPKPNPATPKERGCAHPNPARCRPAPPTTTRIGPQPDPVTRVVPPQPFTIWSCCQNNMDRIPTNPSRFGAAPQKDKDRTSNPSRFGAASQKDKDRTSPTLYNLERPSES